MYNYLAGRQVIHCTLSGSILSTLVHTGLIWTILPHQVIWKQCSFLNCTFMEVHEMCCLHSWCKFSPASFVFVFFQISGGWEDGIPYCSELPKAAQAQQMGSVVLLRNFSLHPTIKLCSSILTNITQSTAWEWTEHTSMQVTASWGWETSYYSKINYWQKLYMTFT